MINYDDEFTAEERLYGHHRGGHRPAPRPHPADEKREQERSTESCKACGARGASWWEIETGDIYCQEHAR